MDDDYTDFTYHGQDNGAITTTRVYLFIFKGANRSHHQHRIFENLQNEVSTAGASKTKREREGKSREGSAALWNLVLDSQFSPEVANVEQGR